MQEHVRVTVMLHKVKVRKINRNEDRLIHGERSTPVLRVDCVRTPETHGALIFLSCYCKIDRLCQEQAKVFV